jgi:hypothetical protein
MIGVSQCTTKPNIDVVNKLVGHEPPMDNIIKLEKEALHLIKSKIKGKDIGILMLPCSSGGIS